ncbi:MAG: ABC transporter substrate-binding protein [Chloroflexota bacterium]
MVLRNRKLLVAAGILTVIGLLLASCGPAEEPTTGGPTTGEPTTGGPTGGPTGEITTLAPTITGMRPPCDILTTTSIGGTSFRQMVWDSLVDISSTGTIQPALAESWKIADNWSKVDFTLRQGLKWPNGDPFTAKDVVFSFGKFTEPGTTFNYSGDFIKYVKDAVAVDDYHVALNLKMAFPVLFDRLSATCAIYPKDYYEKLGQAGFAAAPMGLGPFKVIDFKQDQFINVEALPNHYRVTPTVAKIHLLNVTEPTTKVAMLKTGEADVIYIDLDFVRDVASDKNLQIVTNNDVYQYSFVVHDMVAGVADSPLLDLRVRQAVSLAVDRKTICEKIFSGYAVAGNQFCAPYNQGYDPNLPALTYDPVKAKQLLADAGYPNGFDTTLTYTMARKNEHEAVAAYLNASNIRAKLVPTEAASYTTLRNSSARDPKALKSLRGLTIHTVPYWVGILHTGAAMQSQMAGGSLQSAGVSNPAQVKLIEESMSYAVGDPRLTAIGKQINELALKDLWHIPLFRMTYNWGVGPKVVGGTYLVNPGNPYTFHYENLKLNK